MNNRSGNNYYCTVENNGYCYLSASYCADMVDYTCDFQDIVRYYEGKKITLNCAFDVYSGLKPNISSDVDKMIRHMNDIKIVCANSSSGKQELFALKHTEELIRNVYKKQIKFK